MSVDRRSFLRMVGAGAAASATSSAALASAVQASAAGASSTRPNFLFMIADDLTFRALDALTHHQVRTPNLDRLAARGCRFTHCFHQGSWLGAVCVASRTMLNTGLTAFNAQERTRRVEDYKQHNLVDSTATWGGTLGAAGYDTFISGKWHLDAPLLALSFKEAAVVGPGMLPSTGVRGDAYNRPSPGNEWSPWNKALYGHWMHSHIWERDHGRPDELRHSTEIYIDHAIDHLRNKASQSANPFFMYLGFNAPHDPRQAPKEFLDMYSQESIEVPPNFLAEHPFNEGDHKLRDELLAPFPRTHVAVQMHRREYYAIITHLDHHIGRLLDALEASGKADNTYVILTADHGLCVGEHGLMGKQNLYEASIRMPLIVAGPGVAAGKLVDELVYQHSMFATTCELAGVAVPETVEFPSFASMLHGEPKAQHDAVFSYYRYFQRTVRTKTHKLIVYPQVQVTQLFDVEHDPWETKNLADDPAMAATRAELMVRLRRFQVELGDTLNLDHPTPPPGADTIGTG
jgi:arylsulfatase A-like enzyme